MISCVFSLYLSTLSIVIVAIFPKMTSYSGDLDRMSVRPFRVSSLSSLDRERVYEAECRKLWFEGET